MNGSKCIAAVTESSTEESPRKENISDTVSTYNASLKVKATDPGTITLELTFESQTEDRLRDELSHYTDERALMLFIIKATNIKTADTRTKKYKGCVAPVHCMPLDYTLVAGEEYFFLVDVLKFCPNSGQFTSFLKKEVNRWQSDVQNRNIYNPQFVLSEY